MLQNLEEVVLVIDKVAKETAISKQLIFKRKKCELEMLDSFNEATTPVEELCHRTNLSTDELSPTRGHSYTTAPTLMSICAFVHVWGLTRAPSVIGVSFTETVFTAPAVHGVAALA